MGIDKGQTRIPFFPFQQIRGTKCLSKINESCYCVLSEVVRLMTQKNLKNNKKNNSITVLHLHYYAQDI